MTTEGQSPDALAEGRRIYIGNLDYVLKPTDLKEMLTANGFGEFEHIHVSIDPVSGRNPGYCFVEFHDKETADRAVAELDVCLMGRKLKTGPCEPKKARGGNEGGGSHVFQRWGDWNDKDKDKNRDGNSNSNSGGGSGSGSGSKWDNGQGPRAAVAHFDDMLENFKGRRLYVGGLTRMVDQTQNVEEIREIFAGHEPEAIGKRITPHESTRSKKGNFHYCFVDFRTPSEAIAAVDALDGAAHKDGFLRVSMATRIPDRLKSQRSDSPGGSSRGDDNERPERPSWTSRASRNEASASPRPDANARSEASSRPHYSEGRARALASTDWRRKAPAASASEE